MSAISLSADTAPHTLAIYAAIHALSKCRYNKDVPKWFASTYKDAIKMLDAVTRPAAGLREYMKGVEAIANLVESNANARMFTPNGAEIARRSLGVLDRELIALERIYARQSSLSVGR